MIPRHVNFIKIGRKRYAVELQMRTMNVRVKSELKMSRAWKVIFSLARNEITCELKMSRAWRVILNSHVILSLARLYKNLQARDIFN